MRTALTQVRKTGREIAWLKGKREKERDVEYGEFAMSMSHLGKNIQ